MWLAQPPDSPYLITLPSHAPSSPSFPQSWTGLVRVPPFLDLACYPPGHAHVAGHVAHPPGCVAQESWSGLHSPGGDPCTIVNPLSPSGHGFRGCMASGSPLPYMAAAAAAAANGYTVRPEGGASSASRHLAASAVVPLLPPPPPPPALDTFRPAMLASPPLSATRPSSAGAPAATPVGYLFRHQSLPIADPEPRRMPPATALSSSLLISSYSTSAPSAHGSPCPGPAPWTPLAQQLANRAVYTPLTACLSNASRGHNSTTTTTSSPAALQRPTSEPSLPTCNAHGVRALPAVLEAGESSCPLPAPYPWPFTTNPASTPSVPNGLCSSGPCSSFPAAQHTHANTHRVSHSSCSNSGTVSSPLGTGGLSMAMPLRTASCGIPSGSSCQLLLSQARRTTHRSDSLAKTETALPGSFRAMRLAASAASQGLLGLSAIAAAPPVPPPGPRPSASARLGSCSYGSPDKLASYGALQSAGLYGSPRDAYGVIGTPFLSPTAAALRPLASTVSVTAVAVQQPTVSPVPSVDAADVRATSPKPPAESAKLTAATTAAAAACGSSIRHCRRPAPLQVHPVYESGNGKNSAGASPGRMASPRGNVHVSPTGAPYTSPLAVSSNASADAALSAAGLLRTFSGGEQGASAAEVAAAAAAAAAGVDFSSSLSSAGAWAGAGAGAGAAGGGAPCCWHEIEAHLVTHGTPGGEPALLLIRWVQCSTRFTGTVSCKQACVLYQC